MKFLKNIKIPLLLSATLGLAPFLPEPHIWGKIKWMAGGAVGMTCIDWFDFFLHSFPFAWFLVLCVAKLLQPR